MGRINREIFRILQDNAELSAAAVGEKIGPWQWFGCLYTSISCHTLSEIKCTARLPI